MNLDFLKDLMQTPEGHKLKEFFVSKATELNRLDDIKLDNPEEIALETKSRLKAYKTVKEMLSPLIDATQFDILKGNDDSITTEMLQDERSQPSPEN